MKGKGEKVRQRATRKIRFLKFKYSTLIKERTIVISNFKLWK